MPGVAILSFVRCCGGSAYECQNQRDTGKHNISSAGLDLAFALGPRGNTEANVKSAALAGGDAFLECLGHLLVDEFEREAFLEIAHHARLDFAEHHEGFQRRAV